MISVRMPVWQWQIVLMAFWTLKYAPLPHARKPVLSSEPHELESMQESICDAKDAVGRQIRVTTPAEWWDELKQRELALSLSDQEINDIVAVLQTMLQEAEVNHAHISACVANANDIRTVVAALLEAKKT